MKRPDSQLVELAGRNWLISQLLQAGLEVAKPERDRGIDLIAYLDVDKELRDFVSCPIQMKAASGRSFAIDPKYKRFHRLLLVYVWHVDDSTKTVAFALTYPEALDVARRMGWLKTASWKTGGAKGSRGYSVTTVSDSGRLRSLLEPYRMTPERWQAKIRRIASPK